MIREWIKSEFYKKLIVLVIPIAFQNFMSAAVSASDAIMLGFISQDSLSAVSLAGQIQFVLNLFFMALTIGTTILAAQYWGKGNKEAVEKIFALVIKISSGIGIIFFISAVFASRSLMRIFTDNIQIIEDGALYLRIVGSSYIFASISQIYLCIMKNSGKVLKNTIIGCSAMVFNIILNIIFIFGFMGIPAMGIAGAAFATTLSRFIEMLWAVIESLKKDSIRLKREHIIQTDKILFLDFIKYTMPVLGNELVWGCGFTMFSVIMGHLGSDAVAANSIANIVKNLIACLCLGIGSGSGILIGNELGQGNTEVARQYGDKLCRLSILSGVLSGLVILIISPIILKYTHLSMSAQAYLKWMLIMCSYYMIGKSVNSTVIAGILCAGGDSKFGFLCDTIVLWCIIVPLGLICAFYLKLPVLVVYFILNLDEIIKLPSVYFHYRKYGWVKDLTYNEKVL